jgi:hypothetical protein
VGRNIFGNFTHPFIPKQEGKPTGRMLYLFEEPYLENRNISELLQKIPSWMSAFFLKGPNGEEQVTVSQGLLLPRDLWKSFQDGTLLTHRSIPLYTFTKSAEGDSLKLKLPSGVHYSYETGQPSEMSWDRTSPFRKSFAQIKFPKDNPKNYILNVVHRESATGEPQRHQKYTLPRNVNIISIDPKDPKMPVIFYENSHFGQANFPNTSKQARGYFGIPNTATYADFFKSF